MNHETKHEPNHTAGPTQSTEAGGDFQRVPADCAEGAARSDAAITDRYWRSNHPRLRAESYARACRSRAAVLCASTDAEDALACAVYAARAASDASIRALVADCVAAIYPRLDPRRFHEITASAKGSS